MFYIHSASTTAVSSKETEAVRVGARELETRAPVVVAVEEVGAAVVEELGEDVVADPVVVVEPGVGGVPTRTVKVPLGTCTSMQEVFFAYQAPSTQFWHWLSLQLTVEEKLKSGLVGKALTMDHWLGPTCWHEPRVTLTVLLRAIPQGSKTPKLSVNAVEE